jgi:glycosyltransferase involved in cell wall biosynthesis
VGRAPWVLVAGGFHNHGAMDKANAALASYLSTQNIPVHLVTHRADDVFSFNPAISVHSVGKSCDSFLIAQRNLRRAGRAVAQKVNANTPKARILVNGGNCEWPDINWVHCLHRVWKPSDGSAPLWFKIKNRFEKKLARRNEFRALRIARYVICNSEKTRRALIDRLKVRPQCIRTVYLGADSDWKTSPSRRELSRTKLKVTAGRPLIAFVGALGHDSNKGFDTLWTAWKRLCADTHWDAELAVAGGGRALAGWRKTIERAGMAGHIRFLGFIENIGDLLAAADLLVSPVRYESYGLNVQEALCYGVPSLVSANAGIAERYSHANDDLLLPDPEDANDLATRMLRWRTNIESTKRRIEPIAKMLRKHTWNDMAREIVDFVESRDSKGSDADQSYSNAGNQSADRV